MKVTTFYSYKGGLGRSLLLSHCAKAMAADGKSIVAIDLDLEAPGLPFKLGFDIRSEIGGGIVGLLQQFLAGKPPPQSLRDWVRSVPGHERLSILPAGPLVAATYWNDLAAIDWDQLFRGSDPQGVRFFAWLSESIERDIAPDHLFVDARTGITAMGGAAVSLLADQVIALVGTSPEGIYGTREVLRAITVAPRLAGKAPVRLGVVLSRLPGQLFLEEVQSLRRTIRDRLQADGKSLRATVSVELPMVIRSEPGLERDERLIAESGRLRVHEDYQSIINWIGGAPAAIAAGGSYLSSDASAEVLLDQIRVQRELAERDPASALPELARSLSSLSARLAESGREDAVSVAEEAKSLLEQLCHKNPRRTDHQRDLSVAYERMGDMYRALGKSELAHETLEKALNVRLRLANNEPQRADYQRDLSVSYNKMGDLYIALGQGELARETFQKSLDIRLRLANDEPDRANYQRDLSVSYNKMGDLYRALGQGELARESFQKSLDISLRLANDEPDRADYQRDLSVSYERMASISTGTEAQQWIDRAVQQRRAALTLAPDQAILRRELGIALFQRFRATEDPRSLLEAAQLLVELRRRNALEAQFVPLADKLAGLLDNTGEAGV